MASKKLCTYVNHVNFEREWLQQSSWKVEKCWHMVAADTVAEEPDKKQLEIVDQ